MPHWRLGESAPDDGYRPEERAHMHEKGNNTGVPGTKRSGIVRITVTKYAGGSPKVVVQVG
jgi:hypothetical protein